VFVCFFFVSFLKFTLPPVTPSLATQSQSNDVAKKLALAKEILELQDFKTTVEAGFNSAAGIFSRPQKDSITQKAMTEAKVKFEMQKGKYVADSFSQMEKELISQFSVIELKYLVDILKYPTFKKVTRTYFGE
jgi:hypothetical protein